MKRAAVWLLAILVLAVGLVQWRAPQIAVLPAEGFPGPVWPASGDFAPVAGADVVTDPPLAPPPPVASLTRLAESDGRALLMSQGGVLLAETYGERIGRDTMLNSYSMVKSPVGALVLRAVADGQISGLDTDLREILGPDAPGINIGAALGMTSGLYLAPEPLKGPQSLDDEGGYSAWGPLARLHAFGIRTVLPDLAPEVRQQGSYGWHIRYDVPDRAGQGIADPFAYMTGLGGQMVYLIPGADTVVVRFGAQVQLLHSTIYDLFPARD